MVLVTQNHILHKLYLLLESFVFPHHHNFGRKVFLFFSLFHNEVIQGKLWHFPHGAPFLILNTQWPLSHAWTNVWRAPAHTIECWHSFDNAFVLTLLTEHILALRLQFLYQFPLLVSFLHAIPKHSFVYQPFLTHLLYIPLYLITMLYLFYESFLKQWDLFVLLAHHRLDLILHQRTFRVISDCQLIYQCVLLFHCLLQDIQFIFQFVHIISL